MQAEQTGQPSEASGVARICHPHFGPGGVPNAVAQARTDKQYMKKKKQSEDPQQDIMSMSRKTALPEIVIDFVILQS